MDVKYFYLNIQMDRGKYIMIQISMIPPEFVEKIISQKNTKWIHLCMGNQGYIRTPPAWRIAHEVLVKHLEPYGYHPPSKTTGLWKHDS